MLTKAIEHLPAGTRGARRNVEFGNQFLYRHIHSEEQKLFSAVIQLRQSIFITGAIIPNSENLKRLPWKNLREERARLFGRLARDPKGWLMS